MGLTGEYIRLKRVSKHMTQKELSQKCQVSVAEICRIEKGLRKKISSELVEKIVKALDIEDSDVVKRLSEDYGNKVLIEDYNSEKILLRESDAIYKVNERKTLKNRVDIEKKLEEIMAINLLNEGWEVKFDVAKKYDNKIIRSDIIAKSDKDEWIIEVKSAYNWFYISEDEKKEKVLSEVINFFGRMALNDINISTKISLATDDKIVFKEIGKYTPKAININFSVILIDVENKKYIEKELQSKC